jgi:hypothetical protein
VRACVCVCYSIHLMLLTALPYLRTLSLASQPNPCRTCVEQGFSGADISECSILIQLIPTLYNFKNKMRRYTWLLKFFKVYTATTRHSLTSEKGTNSKHRTNITVCLDKEPRNPMNNRQHEWLLFFFVVQLCTVIFFIWICNILTLLYNHFIVYTQQFIVYICDLNGDRVLKTRLARYHLKMVHMCRNMSGNNNINIYVRLN